MSKYLSNTLQAVTPYTPGEQPQDQKYIKLNTNGNVLRFVPPLIVNEEEIDIVIKAVDEAMTKLGW